MDWFQFETRSSRSLAFGDRFLTVHSWVLQILTPGGGLIWNYPVAVTVRTSDGEVEREERLPIIDPTRLAQVALVGLSLAAAILMWRKKP